MLPTSKLLPAGLLAAAALGVAAWRRKGSSAPAPASPPIPPPAAPKKKPPSPGVTTFSAAGTKEPQASHLLIEAIRAGQEAPITFSPVNLEPGGLQIEVMTDDAKAPVDGQLLRLPISWKEEQEACRILSARLGFQVIPLSEKIADAAYKAANKTVLHGLVGSPEDSLRMRSLDFAKRFNADIDAQVQKLDASGSLVMGAMKTWLLHKRLGEHPRDDPNSKIAINFGGLDTNGIQVSGWDANGKPIQTPGGAHTDAHDDYTQGLRLVKRYASDGTDLLDWIEQHEGVDPQFTAPFRGGAAVSGFGDDVIEAIAKAGERVQDAAASAADAAASAIGVSGVQTDPPVSPARPRKRRRGYVGAIQDAAFNVFSEVGKNVLNRFVPGGGDALQPLTHTLKREVDKSTGHQLTYDAVLDGPIQGGGQGSASLNLPGGGGSFSFDANAQLDPVLQATIRASAKAQGGGSASAPAPVVGPVIKVDPCRKEKKKLRELETLVDTWEEKHKFIARWWPIGRSGGAAGGKRDRGARAGA